MLIYFLLFQFLMQMHIQKNPFKTLFCLFERSNQPDNSSTYSVGLEWGYLMSQRVAERGSIWVNQKQYFCNSIWNDTLQLQVNFLQNNYKQLQGWFPKMCFQNNIPTSLTFRPIMWVGGMAIWSTSQWQRGGVFEEICLKGVYFFCHSIQCCQLSYFVAKFSNFSDYPSNFFFQKHLANKFSNF